MHDTPIVMLAAKQGGVVRRGQVEALGFTGSAIDRRLRSGRWTPVIEGAYRVFPATDLRDLLLGAVVALPMAVVSHASAAELHRLGGPGVPPTVTVGPSAAHRHPEVVVRRARRLPASQITQLEGLPVTTTARTIVDMAADLDEETWRVLAEDAIVGRRCTVDEVATVATVVCGRGWTGSRVVKEFLADRHVGRSRLERAALDALANAGLPAPEVEVPMPWDRVRRFDLAYPAARLAIELDGFRWHADSRRFGADRARDRAALRHGWVVARYTWTEVVGDPRAFARSVVDLLAARTQG